MMSSRPILSRGTTPQDRGAARDRPRGKAAGVQKVLHGEGPPPRHQAIHTHTVVRGEGTAPEIPVTKSVRVNWRTLGLSVEVLVPGAKDVCTGERLLGRDSAAEE